MWHEYCLNGREGSKMDIFPMIELILLCAAVLAIAVPASVRNNRRFAPVPTRMRKRQP